MNQVEQTGRELPTETVRHAKQISKCVWGYCFQQANPIWNEILNLGE